MNGKQFIVWFAILIVLSVSAWALAEALGFDGPPWSWFLIGGTVGLPWGFYGSRYVKERVK